MFQYIGFKKGFKNIGSKKLSNQKFELKGFTQKKIWIRRF